MALTLHGYFRSSTSLRVRVALNYKGLAYEQVTHHLRKGEHRTVDYLDVNPQGLVPALVTDTGVTLTQSPAILEWLEEAHPEPPLLPGDIQGRARVRALAAMIGCEIHPLNNLRVLNALKTRFDADDDAVAEWFRHWVGETFAPLERRLSNDAETGRFCHGDTPTLADVYLYAQVINNRRFAVPSEVYPTIMRIFAACEESEAFAAARPENQPDAE
ncbi:maleylacetoacetate isomerase [Pararhizobium haloflavum]|uniref:maleylacetoacetate isomerase n=1 Tax=Pararhizobium haloflavum TaxID=2037914 RepID=UPI000C17570D|nr:maleylacetoacetate isomerase [Pararhizobium haloflavum]